MCRIKGKVVFCWKQFGKNDFENCFEFFFFNSTWKTCRLPEIIMNLSVFFYGKLLKKDKEVGVKDIKAGGSLKDISLDFKSV